MAENAEGLGLLVVLWPVLSAWLVGLASGIELASPGIEARLAIGIYGFALASFFLAKLAQARGGVFFADLAEVSSGMRLCLSFTCFLLGYALVSWVALI